MDEKKLTIYFTSDLHGYIYPTDYRGQGEKELGLFKCASRFRKDGNTLVIDGGDILQGSPLGAFCHDTIGSAARFAEMMNRCGYDYVTLGNHDFNYGMPYLDSYLNVLKARCVCENVRWDEAGVRFPARIHTLENGLRVGIIGIVTDYVNIWEKPEHLAGIAITDPIPAVATALERLRDQVDLTVGIYHGGFERDLATGRVLSATRENVAYRICQELDLDILLTGHQHMSVPGQMVSGTFVVQPSDKGQEFLRVEAAVSGSGKRFSSETVPAHGECRADWLAEFADMVIVAVKPHQVEAVLSPVKELLAGKIVVSVAAGMTFGKYETILAPGTHHLSTVPNTPVAVGEGIVVCERLHSLSDAEWKETERLFSHVGLVMQVDTPLLGLAGTICGCGPAFVAMFIEALADAAVKHGIARADAYRMVSQMVVGTGKLQLATGQHPGAMKDAVCSPGGTTIVGVAELERKGFRGAVIDAVDAIQNKK